MKFGKTNKVKITDSLKIQRSKRNMDRHMTANRREQIDRARKTGSMRMIHIHLALMFRLSFLVSCGTVLKQ